MKPGVLQTLQVAVHGGDCQAWKTWWLEAPITNRLTAPSASNTGAIVPDWIFPGVGVSIWVHPIQSLGCNARAPRCSNRYRFPPELMPNRMMRPSALRSALSSLSPPAILNQSLQGVCGGAISFTVTVIGVCVPGGVTWTVFCTIRLGFWYFHQMP